MTDKEQIDPTTASAATVPPPAAATPQSNDAPPVAEACASASPDATAARQAASTASSTAAAPAGPLLDRLPLRGRGGLALLAVALIGLFGWQMVDLRHRVSQTQEQLARRLAEGATQLRDARNLAANAQEALQTQASKISVLESKIGELSSQQGSLEGLYQELARGRDEWLLSEVDQLVGLAAQQLQLAGNVQGAILALSNADARLARSERPRFIALRKAIGKDLQKLRGLPLVDSAGVALRLENTALAVDQMTLAFEARPQTISAVGTKTKPKPVKESPELAPSSSGDWTHWWRRWATEIWLEVHNLIRVERFDRPDPAILAPQHAVFLRENLKLRLLGARLALLGRDQTTFKGELRQAVQWLEKYFDPRERNVLSALEALKPLLASELSIEPPVLTESLSALRAVKLSAERAVR